jgi:hypothetical protein
MRFDKFLYDLSSILSIALFIIPHISIVWLFKVVKNNIKNLDSAEFKNMYGQSLFEGINLKS